MGSERESKGALWGGKRKTSVPTVTIRNRFIHRLGKELLRTLSWCCIVWAFVGGGMYEDRCRTVVSLHSSQRNPPPPLCFPSSLPSVLFCLGSREETSAESPIVFMSTSHESPPLTLTKQHMQTPHASGPLLPLAPFALSDLFVSAVKVSAQHNVHGFKPAAVTAQSASCGGSRNENMHGRSAVTGLPGGAAAPSDADAPSTELRLRDAVTQPGRGKRGDNEKVVQSAESGSSHHTGSGKPIWHVKEKMNQIQRQLRVWRCRFHPGEKTLLELLGWAREKKLQAPFVLLLIVLNIIRLFVQSGRKFSRLSGKRGGGGGAVWGIRDKWLGNGRVTGTRRIGQPCENKSVSVPMRWNSKHVSVPT